MPVKTTILSTSPALVEQHELFIPLECIGDTEATKASSKVLSATILTYGATLTHLVCPDRWNQSQDVVLGFDHWQDYLAQAQPGALNPYFGSIIGRTASRIGNASFVLENKYSSDVAATDSRDDSASTERSAVSQTPRAVSESISQSLPASHIFARNDGTSSTHTLKISNGVDCLHGGPFGFDKQHWTTVKVDQEQTAVTLQLISPHGQNGYPGRLVTNVKYSLTAHGELIVEYWAQLEAGHSEGEQISDPATQDLHSTIVSLTNHAYWNLDGVLNPVDDQGLEEKVLQAMEGINDKDHDEDVIYRGQCSIRNHTLWLRTAKLVELGASHPIPTGRILDLSNNSDQLSPSAELLEQKDPLNFTSPRTDGTELGKSLGPGLDEIPGGYGYDHVYALDDPTLPARSVSEIGIQAYWPSTHHVATLASPRTGIRLDLSTSEPALVVYAGGYLDSEKLLRTKSRLLDMSSTPFFISPSATPLQNTQDCTWKNNQHRDLSVRIEADMGKFSGVCLEPIRYPDAIHHSKWANMVTLHHGQVYRQTSTYKFSVDTQTKS
ncbi:hypothetical protein BG011_006491 [Mortierella polycephala]|uniref:Aldose 1-epimerase n=1 Tax=Mortierella polycephala TaxID=41804 RepID=A0A9P6TYX8_9FUNG|nr:hypothetical protein BG011_006491 [Mortierella polycephala]